ncbi:hypothetical protein H6F67_08340 [Microcoleus sp. FACHB-1515]|uniref:hypothetical protein n=1 Tax=Cyanophyceae TaxID=3028117 RepID=UPI001681E7FD|nr:hypothetical protein [Microcoleus sp. FACHB-1515]MBD2089861.1 hypothetical protein [Microcoleus sp. FACHB-1515]
MPRQKRQFNGLSYREVQRANSQNRLKLHKPDQKQLKAEGYKNTGWDQVIRLYQKIEELLDRYQYADLELDELFLEADRIGNKYLTPEEIEEYNQKLDKEVSEIEEAIDRQFPDTEVEIIDFSNRRKTRSR